MKFLLFRLPGDTIFNTKTSARSFTMEKAAVFYRLAEICRDKCDFAKMDELLTMYIKDGHDELTLFSALCLTGNIQKAYALAPALFKNSSSAETLFLAADPWANIHEARRIKTALLGVETSFNGLKGQVKSLASVHRFILSERAGLKPAFRAPRAPESAGNIMYLPAAEVLMGRFEFEMAEKILRAAADAWPASEIACGKLAEAMFCGGKRKAAIEFMAFGQKRINSPGFSAWRGQLLLFSSRYRESVRELDKTIGAGNDLGWCWRGAALFKLGRKGPAMENLTEAIKINPNDLEARVWRAEMLRTGKKFTRALDDLNHTLKIMPEHPWALANLALLAAERGDPAGFSSHYSRLPETLKFACGRGDGNPAALSELLAKLKGIRRHEPHFFHNLTTR